MNTLEEKIQDIVDLIIEDYGAGRDIDRMELSRQPDKEVIIDIIGKLYRIVYPGYARDRSYRIYHPKYNLSMVIEDVIFNLSCQISTVLSAEPAYETLGDNELDRKAKEISLAFFRRIPQVRALAQTDVQAAYDADPAAYSRAEVIYSYPGLFAITVYRLAHELYLLGVPMIPRIMTEHAHSVTGIDIHPAATIADHFFIDHGTGVVIGETTVIGANVRIYQGVTLGALTTRGGQSLRGVRRHPTIEDDVTIYAGASILGGQTIIGRGAVVGSNAFITSSVEPKAAVRGRRENEAGKSHMS